MSSFSILVDTNTDLPLDYLDEHKITMIPLAFILNGKMNSGGRWQETSDKEFYDALRDGGTASTSLVNQEAFFQFFTECAKKGEALLVVTLSSGLSGTYQNAVLALDEIKTVYPDCDIHVVDSINAAGGAGLVASFAVDKRKEGFSAAQTAAFLEDIKHSCLALFTVDDLMYLHRGGRLSKFSAIAGSIIGIKPLLNVAPDGTLKLKDKVRGRKAALSTLLSQMKRSLNPGTKLTRVIISHSDCLEDGESLATMIRNELDADEIIVTMMGPIIGTHVGPGCVALFFQSDMKREEYEAKFYPEK